MLNSNLNVGNDCVREDPLRSQEERIRMDEGFTDMMKIVKKEDSHLGLNLVKKSLVEAMEYNVYGGNRARGLLFLKSYQILTENGRQENDLIRYNIAWSVEVFKTYFNLINEIAYTLKMRRGQPSWISKVGLKNAARDVIMVRNAVLDVLRSTVFNKPYYDSLIDCVFTGALETEWGQKLDTIIEGKRDLSSYTMSEFRNLIRYKKCSTETFVPVQWAMLMVGLKDPQDLNRVQDILFDINVLLEAAKEVGRLYKDPTMNKTAADIGYGKCTWMVVKALELADEESRAMLDECYGFTDKYKINRVKELYKKLNFPSVYKKFFEIESARIAKDLRNNPPPIPVEIFNLLLQSIAIRHSQYVKLVSLLSE